MMKVINNFTRYIPDDPSKLELIKSANVIFLRSDNGQDWYECQKEFQEDTIKIMYDAEGIIRSITKDVSGLFPENGSVAEVLKTPDDMSIDGCWQFDGENIIPRIYTIIELQQQANSQKTKLIDEATKAIAPLQDTVDLDIASESEKSKLTAWKQYRALVNRVDITLAPDITWPSIP